MTAIISMLIFVHRKIAIIKVIIILLHGGTRVMSSQYAHNPNWTVPCRWTHEKSPQTGTYLFPAALLHRFVLTWSYLVFQYMNATTGRTGEVFFSVLSFEEVYFLTELADYLLCGSNISLLWLWKKREEAIRLATVLCLF